ncbi:type VII secretion target [Nocardioides litoris]|uniref:type VII secretion target n=1 Tax=Nocardioides litoris TaxID=1926648 RepID=UPI00112067F6|nr:type VII secretion target [Nocardioides litoris]
MSSQVRVDPASLRRLAGDLDDVVSALASAQSSITGSEVSADTFSPAGEILAYVFAASIEYAGTDAFEQAAQVGSIQDRLFRTADQWEAAEEASTVREV